MSSGEKMRIIIPTYPNMIQVVSSQNIIDQRMGQYLFIEDLCDKKRKERKKISIQNRTRLSSHLSNPFSHSSPHSPHSSPHSP